MTKKERAKKIHKILSELYPEPVPSLDYKDNFTFLVAVMLSANSRDAVVNKITPQLFAKADSPQKMVRLSISEIEEIIRPCGLAPRKSKALWNMSKMLLEKYEGNVPSAYEGLVSLPGVGHKTASVVLCRAFNQYAFPVDTHIHRLAKRWGLSSGKNRKQTEKDLKDLFPKKDWADVHIQMIYFGREHCPALRHDASKCPICSWL